MQFSGWPTVQDTLLPLTTGSSFAVRFSSYGDLSAVIHSGSKVPIAVTQSGLLLRQAAIAPLDPAQYAMLGRRTSHPLFRTRVQSADMFRMSIAWFNRTNSSREANNDAGRGSLFKNFTLRAGVVTINEVAAQSHKFQEVRMTNSPDPYDRPLPAAVSTWAIAIGNCKELNYGQMHDLIHRDIAIGNDYRKERIKLLITLATGVFALSVTFHKDLFGSVLTSTGLSLVLFGWAAMIVSLGAGIVHFRKWEDFYLEHRVRGNAVWRYYVATASSDASEELKARIAFHKSRERINDLQKSYAKWNFIQSTSLVVGMVSIALYAAVSGKSALEKAMSESVKATQQGTAVLSVTPGATVQLSVMPSERAASSVSNTQALTVKQPAPSQEAPPSTAK